MIIIYLLISFIIVLPMKYRVSVGNIIKVPGFHFKIKQESNTYSISLFSGGKKFLYKIDSKNIKQVSVAKGNKQDLWMKSSGVFKRVQALKRMYVDDPNNTICIEFVKPIKYVSNTLVLFFLGGFIGTIWGSGGFPNLDKIYVSVKDPHRVIEHIEKIKKK